MDITGIESVLEAVVPPVIAMICARHAENVVGTVFARMTLFTVEVQVVVLIVVS